MVSVRDVQRTDQVQRDRRAKKRQAAAAAAAERAAAEKAAAEAEAPEDSGDDERGAAQMQGKRRAAENPPAAPPPAKKQGAASKRKASKPQRVDRNAKAKEAAEPTAGDDEDEDVSVDDDEEDDEEDETEGSDALDTDFTEEGEEEQEDDHDVEKALAMDDDEVPLKGGTRRAFAAQQVNVEATLAAAQEARERQDARRAEEGVCVKLVFPTGEIDVDLPEGATVEDLMDIIEEKTSGRVKARTLQLTHRERELAPLAVGRVPLLERGVRDDDVIECEIIRDKAPQAPAPKLQTVYHSPPPQRATNVLEDVDDFDLAGPSTSRQTPASPVRPRAIGLKKATKPTVTGMPAPKETKQKRVVWTERETNCLIKGVELEGENWQAILTKHFEPSSTRTGMNLRDKWRNLCKTLDNTQREIRSKEVTDELLARVAKARLNC